MLNVSESGMLARFDVPVELWEVGEISLTVGEYYIEIEVRVARVMGDEYGLSFLIESDNDRLAIRIMNDSAKAAAIAAGLPLSVS